MDCKSYSPCVECKIVKTYSTIEFAFNHGATEISTVRDIFGGSLRLTQNFSIHAGAGLGHATGDRAGSVKVCPGRSIRA